MKRILFLLLAVALSAGCARTYNITLNNGMTVTAHGKPKRSPSGGSILYVDANGQTNSIPQGAVRGFAPASWTSKDEGKTSPFIQ